MGISRLPREARALAILLLAFGLLAACNVSLAPEHEEDQPELITVSLEEGQTMRQGDVIDLTVQLPDGPPAGSAVPTDTSGPQAPTSHTLEVLLEETTTGAPVASRTFPVVTGEPLQPITLDDLGLTSQGYRLTVRLLAGTELLGQKVVDFFYVGTEYELDEITSDAPSIHPGSTVVLTAVLRVPEGADPVLEWSTAGEVFARGSLSEGLDTVEWTSPAIEGIYKISVSLLPLGVPSASIPLSTDVYVSVVKDPVGELAPADSYFSLYHLLGDLADAGASAQPASFLLDNPLRLLTRGRTVGYELDGERGFSVPALVVPAKEGALEPFTITIGLTPSEVPLEGALVRVSTADGTFDFSIGFEAGPTLVAELRLPQGANKLTAEASALTAGRRSALSFSLYPPGGGVTPTAGAAGAATATGGLRAVWFIDGAQVAEANWAVTPRLPSTRGSSTVGGPGSVHGLLDELGVYYRDEQGRAAPDPGIFGRSVAEQYGSAAEGDGFDGLYLSGAYTTEGNAGVNRGLLEVAPGGSVTLPAHAIEQAGVSIRLALAADPDAGSLISLLWDTGAEQESPTPLVTLSGAGTLTAGESVATYRFSARREVTFSLRPEAEQLRVEIGGLDGEPKPSFSVSLGAREIPAVIVRLAVAPDARSALLVDDLAFVPLQ